MPVYYDPVAQHLAMYPPRFTSLEASVSKLDERIRAIRERLLLDEERISTLETNTSSSTTETTKQQLAFFTLEGWQNLGSISCGNRTQDSYFPLDWTFGEWSWNGIILHFGEWSASETA